MEHGTINVQVSIHSILGYVTAAFLFLKTSWLVQYEETNFIHMYQLL